MVFLWDGMFLIPERTSTMGGGVISVYVDGFMVLLVVFGFFSKCSSVL